MLVSTVVPAGMFPLFPIWQTTNPSLSITVHNSLNTVTESETDKTVRCARCTHSFRLVCTEEAGVMALLDHDVGDTGLVVLLQLDTGVADRQQLVV